jgi:N-acetylglucosamine-6-phosphate deacetylase
MGGRTVGPALIAIGDGSAMQGCVRIEQGRIAQLADGPQFLDLELPFGSTVTPGLIDLQINGSGDSSFNREPLAALDAVATAGPMHGVTSFLPTIITGPLEQMLRSARAVFHELERARPGARPLGVHFEGPFLSPAYRRYHPAEHLLLATPARIEALLDTWTFGLCRVTMAPELEGASDAAAELRRRGVILSAGHSAATFDQGKRAIDEGYSILTHAFNAMPSLHHRGSTLLAAYLLDDRAYCEVIVDGIHVAPEYCALVAKLKGGHLVLTSDMMALGAGVVEDGGVARTLDGVIAGSRLRLDEAVRNLMSMTGLPLAQAIRSATAAPACAIGLDNEIGLLREGMRADLAVWDRHGRISHVFVGGELVYAND